MNINAAISLLNIFPDSLITFSDYAIFLYIN